MARYGFTRACGHPDEVVLYGPRARRERQLDYEASRLCRECYLARQREQAAGQSAAEGLPDLAGTPRQVEWATVLRVKALQVVDEVIRDASTRGLRAKGVSSPDALPPDEREKWEAETAHIAAAMAWLRGQTVASWWIDHRLDSGRLLLAVGLNQQARAAQ